MTSASEIRDRFRRFFAERGHEVVPSSPLVPPNDPTLMFANAGMVQFKDVFTGQETRAVQARDVAARSACASAASTTTSRTSASPRATTRSSRCSATSRFGDYFKEDAIAFAWELLTEVLRHPEGAAGRHRVRRRGAACPPTTRRARSGARSPASATTASSRLGSQGQLLADGRHRPVRSVLRDPLLLRRRRARPRALRRRAGRPTARAGSRSGTSSSCSSSARRGRRQARAAAGAVDRHRRGPRARGVRAPGRASATTTPICCGRSSSRPRRSPARRTAATLARRRRVDARHRRPRARDGVPDRRRRVPGSRRAARTCCAASCAARFATGTASASSGRSCTRCALEGRRADGRRSTRELRERSALIEQRHRSRKRSASARRSKRGLRSLVERSVRADGGSGARVLPGDGRVQALRHLRLPARPHGSDRPRAALRGRQRRLRARARARARAQRRLEGRRSRGRRRTARQLSSGACRASEVRFRLRARERALEGRWRSCAAASASKRLEAGDKVEIVSDADAVLRRVRRPSRRRGRDPHRRRALRVERHAEARSRAWSCTAASSTRRRNRRRRRGASSRSITRCARPRAATTARRTSCTSRCAGWSASTRCRRARSSGPIACASTTARARRSPPSRSRASKTS